MRTRVVECVFKMVEQVIFVGEPVEDSNNLERPAMVTAGTLEQHSDVASFELGDNLSERMRTGRVEDLEIRKPQYHDANIADGREFGQEPLCGTEEEGSVDAVDEDVLTQQLGFSVGIDGRVGRERLGMGGGRAGYRP